MRIVDSHLCTFCQISEEPLENIFIHCAILSAFWLSVDKWLENPALSCNSRFDRCEGNAWALWKINAIN